MKEILGSLCSNLAEGLSFPGCKCPSGIQGGKTGVAQTLVLQEGVAGQLLLIASRPGRPYEITLEASFSPYLWLQLSYQSPQTGHKKEIIG
jgi:hypothetical protein